jgi:protein-disulfide isomerase
MNIGFLTAKVFFALASICVTSIVGSSSTTVKAQSGDIVVARVNTTTITLKEVDSSVAAAILPLQEQIYALRRAALENLITRTILASKAREKGISVEELRQQLTNGSVETKREDIDNLYAENAASFASMSADEAKERLRLDLETQARMRKYREALAILRQNSSTQVLLEEPRLPRPVELTAPSIGPPQAIVTITEFSDFKCPYCREVQATIKEILKSYSGNVRLIFKHLPLEIHADAFPAAKAAFCAEDQGKFWQYHDALFTSEALSAEALDKIAVKLGLNLSKFKACLLSESASAAVRKDIHEARQLGIHSTPTFIINGKLMRGARPFAEFKATIEHELDSARNTSRPKSP